MLLFLIPEKVIFEKKSRPLSLKLIVFQVDYIKILCLHIDAFLS